MSETPEELHELAQAVIRERHSAESDSRRVVLHWVARLIDYGKGSSDPELDDLSLGQVADRIIECVTPPGVPE